jgi:uracil-DNA glycosylase
MDRSLQLLVAHQSELAACRRCDDMSGPVVIGAPAMSPIIQVGQAPGRREGEFGRPFAWTAGKTLFGWYAQLGVSEDVFRERVYMAAVCRCFPGRNPRGGDRVPSPGEIAKCAAWLDAEIALLHPQLLIPVGKLAIARFLDFSRLTEVVGRQHRVSRAGSEVDMVPLPHPSGVSTWHRVEPGKTLLQDALGLIAEHPAWKALFSR